MVAATVQLIFAEHDADAARGRLREAAATLEGRFPKVAQLLEDAEADVTAYAAFPRSHHRRSPLPTR